MITPREDFRKIPNAGKLWPDMVDNPLMRSAISAALQQMQIDLAPPPDMASAASYAYRMEGAKQFLRIFMGLVDPSPVSIRPPTGNLKQ